MKPWGWQRLDRDGACTVSTGSGQPRNLRPLFIGQTSITQSALHARRLLEPPPPQRAPLMCVFLFMSASCARVICGSCKWWVLESPRMQNLARPTCSVSGSSVATCRTHECSSVACLIRKRTFLLRSLACAGCCSTASRR
jgi:hypothetical protein